jgi:AcrR family transcriptional regulator
MTIRDRILDAALKVLRDQGPARATTKEIARVAGCSEGSLYNHFENKESLFVAVVMERLPPFVALLKTLLERVGEGMVRDHLEEVARTALEFYIEAMPLAAAALAAPDIREGLRLQNAGPHRGNEMLAIYLRLEQRLGRIHKEISPEAAAALLLGACQQRAMHLPFLAEDAVIVPAERFAQELVAGLMRGLTP